MADEPVDDAALFDEVMNADANETAPAESTAETVEAPADGPPRDENGRFAPKAETETTEAPEAAPPAAKDTAEVQPDASGMVPQQALHEARQLAKQERETRERLERELAALRQPQPATPAEPPRVPDPWDPDFADYQRNQVETAIQKQKMATSQLLAVDKFGAETVSAAETALVAAVRANPSLMADVRRILASPHPYAETVAWHKAQQARARVGDDPDAFVNAEIERMLADPAKRAALVARATGAPAAVSAAANPASSRTIPPSLSKLSAASATPTNSEPTDEELLRSVLSQ